MRCGEVQELIITDYLDGEMDNKKKAALEEHLAHCPACKEFSLAAGKVSPRLFIGMERVKPPEFIWNRIKENIITERRKKTSFAAKFFERIRYAFYIPNQALAFATIFALILVFGAITKLTVSNQALLTGNGREQIEYFDYANDVQADVSANEEPGFGTSIEQYFL